MNITVLVLLVVFSILIAYDVYIDFKKGDEFTISRITYKYSVQYPLVPFLIGMICGHLFWGNPAVCK